MSAVHAPTAADDYSNWWGIVINAPASLQSLVHGIQNETAISITDGLFKNSSGTAGFVLLHHLHSSDSFTLVNQMPGNPSNMDPYCTELSGIYGIVATTNEICALFAITHYAMIIGCDCELALYNLQRPYDPYADQPHHDS